MLTQAEKNFIAENAGRLKDREIAAALSRLAGRPISTFAVQKARHRLGIAKRPGHGVCEIRLPEPPASGAPAT